jgi:LysM repeat protein
MLKRALCALILTVLLAACAPESIQLPPPSTTPLPINQTATSSPTPLPTSSATPTSTANNTPTASNTPTDTATQTPTPFYYQVKQDDDLFGIALRFGIPLAALKTANPSVNPNAIGENTTLVVPVTATPGASPTPLPPTIASASLTPIPTPTPNSAYPVYGYVDALGGLWVFVQYRSKSEQPVENPSALVSLLDKNGGAKQEMVAVLPLNILEPGSNLPLVAYFPAPIPTSFILSAQPDFELPVPEADTRYLKTMIADEKVSFAEDKKSAEVEVKLSFEGGQVDSAVAIFVAFGNGGQPVGYRQIELENPKNEVNVLKIKVYSLGPEIETVKIYAEAKPAWK